MLRYEAPKGCNTLPWARRSEKGKLETAVRQKGWHLRKQTRNAVSRQKGIGLAKVTTLAAPRSRRNSHATEREGNRETQGNILSTRGLQRQPRKTFQTSDSVIQLAKEELSCGVVLNPMDIRSLSHLRNMSILNLSQILTISVTANTRSGFQASRRGGWGCTRRRRLPTHLGTRPGRGWP